MPPSNPILYVIEWVVSGFVAIWLIRLVSRFLAWLDRKKENKFNAE